MIKDVAFDLSAHPRDLAAPVDFAFLAVQTFDDVDLQKEVLALFVAQARRLVSTLPGLDAGAEGDVAHLLKGSARGIGAWPTVQAAEAYEASDPEARPAAYCTLATELTVAETAIGEWLAGHAGARATI